MENKIEKIKLLEQRIKALEIRKLSQKNIDDDDIESHIQRLRLRKLLLENPAQSE